MSNRLKELRQQQGLRQKDVAQRIGIDRTAYLRMEKGERLPRVDVACLLARLYGVSVEEIFEKKDS